MAPLSHRSIMEKPKMKIVAINRIDYTTAKGDRATALPGVVFDVPKDQADLLLKGMMPPARRMTADEIELDKHRASAQKRGAQVNEDDEDDEEDDTAGNGDDTAGKGGDKAPEKPAEKPAAKTAAKAGKANDY